MHRIFLHHRSVSRAVELSVDDITRACAYVVARRKLVPDGRKLLAVPAPAILGVAGRRQLEKGTISRFHAKNRSPRRIEFNHRRSAADRRLDVVSGESHHLAGRDAPAHNSEQHHLLHSGAVYWSAAYPPWSVERRLAGAARERLSAQAPKPLTRNSIGFAQCDTCLWGQCSRGGDA